MKKEEKKAISEEVAVKEFKAFVEKWSYEKKDDWEIKDDYPMALMAMQDGLLVFDSDLKPSYTLKFPLKSESGTNDTTELSFRTRIKPMDLSNISKGLNIQKQQQEYALRCLAYISGEAIGIINKLEKYDYKVLEQVATVFM